MLLWRSCELLHTHLYRRSCCCSYDHVWPHLLLFHSYCCLYLVHWLPTALTVWGLLKVCFWTCFFLTIKHQANQAFNCNCCFHPGSGCSLVCKRGAPAWHQVASLSLTSSLGTSSDVAGRPVPASARFGGGMKSHQTKKVVKAVQFGTVVVPS